MKSMLVIIGDFETPDAEHQDKGKFEPNLREIVQSAKTIRQLATNVLLIKANGIVHFGDVLSLCKNARRTYSVIFLEKETEMVYSKSETVDNLI